ncbi:hypothetical protein [Neptunitalea lumnitzerae]|uniref:Uncharacterized protein n=1 Tax=Neptunitalea lumnitzerae TaxID=2965509 RepID=A0ABQ5MGC7_9FLAO|nr:hypothetical protein [Neptunitalea sp. Y10]GLB48412.1 hypothetical protein Y10_07800 [Neptunitalea sp. Y10]
MKPFIICCLLILFTSCSKPNFHLHKSITDETFKKIRDIKVLKEGDSIWLTSETLCIKDGEDVAKIGNIRKGRKRGKWYYYRITNSEENKDTLICYLIKQYRKRDTLQIYSSSVNWADW